MPTAKSSNAGKRVARQRKELWVEDGRGELYRRATIDVLPDDVLLESFNFYVDRVYAAVDEWHTLVHVCGRWRYVVFASPRRLNLRLLCTRETPVKTLLGIWPELPIVIHVYFSPRRRKEDTNIDTALKHNDRLRSNDKMASVIPDSFMGGSAPRLGTLRLNGIPFPGLPKLLLSAHGLVDLHLWNIPRSGYISPEAMVTALSSLTNLRELRLGFQSPRPRLSLINRRPSTLTRAVLPTLTSLHFKGVSEYLEVFISRIDVPLLKNIIIVFFNQLVFDVSLLRKFIRRTEAFKALHRARIFIFDDSTQVAFPLTNPEPEEAYDKHLELGISCKPLDWQLSSLAQVCIWSLPPLPTLERLDILWRRRSKWQGDIENTQWLEVLQPFFAVKNLYLDKNAAPHVAPALQALAGGQVTEVLPALQNIFLKSLKPSGPVHEAFAQFAAARQLLGHPTAVRHWE